MLDAQALGQGEISIVARRNCSIAPSALCIVFAALMLVTAGIALAWGLAAGAWPMLPFAGVEAVALGIALVAYARRAGDYERISLAAGRLVVEVREGWKVARHEFDSSRARLVAPRGSGRLLLRGQGRELELGRFVDDADRERLADELSRLVARARPAH